jgi:hypothetical protein
MKQLYLGRYSHDWGKNSLDRRIQEYGFMEGAIVLKLWNGVFLAEDIARIKTYTRARVSLLEATPQFETFKPPRRRLSMRTLTAES